MNDLERLRNALADHYRIESEIGAGGMATVFLAHDLKHDRKVAIKVLHADVARAIGSDRFLNEIRVAARFAHPNIVGLIDSGSADLGGGAPTPYYVMPFVDGESLRQRLGREPQLPITDALRIAGEVADALAHAHAQGVVHRDIKPENILLTSGHALVTDFGIAKAVVTAGGSDLTTHGVIVGTPAYMSPEQASGERALDGRVDVYALGCVLYEMLAGEHPFSAPTAQQMILRALTERPRPLSARRPAVSPQIGAVVVRALERLPSDRYSSAAEFAAALGTAQGSAPPRDRRSSWRAVALVGLPLLVLAGIALAVWSRREGGSAVTGRARSLVVLPFANTSGNRGDEYFSDGMTDELAAALAKVPGLRVAARSSAYQFKGQSVDVHEIGRRLSVGAVVDGSVRRNGDMVNITAQLVTVEDGLTLWSDSYVRGVADVFTVQHQIASAVARALQLGAANTSGSAGTTSAEAHDLFLRGRYFWNLRDREGFRRGIDYFEQAIARDSGYAQAWAGLGDAYSLSGGFGYLPPAEAFAKARAAANHALALDSTLADAHTALGFIHLFYDWDWRAARERLEQALALDPQYGEARLFHGWYFIAVNRLDDAIGELREAVADEPISLILNTRLGSMLMFAGRTDEAVAQFNRVLELDPGYRLAHLDLARIYAARGDQTKALDEWSQTAEYVGAYGAGVYGYALARAGRRNEAMAEIRRLERDTLEPYANALPIAQIYGGLGDRDHAFMWLDRAYADRNWPLYLVRVDPLLQPLHDDPRWETLVRRMNFP
ncbi:MAG TPA: protein kinase [Gemmatimonadales bacterium]|nr:protein kinase [Gemmatimonadales bacterium]